MDQSWRGKEWKRPEIVHGIPTKWNWVVAYQQNLVLGEFVDIGAFCYLNAHFGITLEDGVQIGGGSQLHTDNTIEEIKGEIILRKGACVGANSVILPNVEVGEGSIVGALSLVKSGTKIPPHEVWGGIPAKRISVMEQDLV